MSELINNLTSGSLYYESTSFGAAFFTLLLAFVLSSIVAFTYRYTFRGYLFPNHFFQAMVLSSVVTGMIMMAVGNNFAVGFGIIGAVAIIRFRTVMQDPRNIIFMFSAISIGIATGVKGYPIAVAGTGLFCLIALLLYWSEFGRKTNYVKLVVVAIENPNVEERIASACKKVSVKSIRRLAENKFRFEYLVNLGDGSNDQLLMALESEEIIEVRVEHISSNEHPL